MSAKRFDAQTEPAARCAFGWPASAATSASAASSRSSATSAGTRLRREIQGGSSSTSVPRASRKTARVIALILPDGMIPAADQTFWQAHGDQISAAITLVVAVAIAIVVDRVLIGATT